MQTLKKLLNFMIPLLFISIIGFYGNLLIVTMVCFTCIFAKEAYDIYRFGEEYLNNAFHDIMVRISGMLVGFILLIIQNTLK